MLYNAAIPFVRIHSIRGLCKNHTGPESSVCARAESPPCSYNAGSRSLSFDFVDISVVVQKHLFHRLRESRRYVQRYGYHATLQRFLLPQHRQKRQERRDDRGGRGRAGAAAAAGRVDVVLLLPPGWRQLRLLDGDGARPVQRGDAERPAFSEGEIALQSLSDIVTIFPISKANFSTLASLPCDYTC